MRRGASLLCRASPCDVAAKWAKPPIQHQHRKSQPLQDFGSGRLRTGMEAFYKARAAWPRGSEGMARKDHVSQKRRESCFVFWKAKLRQT